MKETLRDKINGVFSCRSSGDEMIIAANKYLYQQTADFYEAGIHSPIRRLNTAIERDDGYFEK